MEINTVTETVETPTNGHRVNLPVVVETPEVLDATTEDADDRGVIAIGPEHDDDDTIRIKDTDVGNVECSYTAKEVRKARLKALTKSMKSFFDGLLEDQHSELYAKRAMRKADLALAIKERAEDRAPKQLNRKK